MIMPCMHSTSACDCGGSVALVDGGSVLLGFPGAPGCTTTGFALSFCGDWVTARTEPALAASNTPQNANNAPNWVFLRGPHVPSKRRNPTCVASLSIHGALRCGTRSQPGSSVFALQAPLRPPHRRRSIDQECGQ